jgi:protein-S-isoprenylcysteine O-methyltransferase Ste14
MISIVSDIIVLICLLALFTAIIINFFEAKKEVSKEKKSVVETGSMTGYFILVYILVRLKVGHFDFPETVTYVLNPVGLLMIIAGCLVNIKGRLALGANWANQVTIYQEQTLVRSGVYRYVRHPLYASLIWMFYGASLVYANYLVFLSTTFIFVPFMYYRAKQEEKLLEERFNHYAGYKRSTGMLFPKIFRR